MTTHLLDDHPRLGIVQAARWIREGELVAFPTETVYGLGGNGLSAESAAKIYEAKGRPSDNPLILHIDRFDWIEELAKDYSEVVADLARAFWPGPLTLVLPKKEIVPLEITGGLDTVAIRIPDHPVALRLLEHCDLPLAAPSANRSGNPSPTAPEHVMEDLNGRIKAVIDGGATRIGLESTVLDLSHGVPTILRPGAVTIDQLKEVLPDVQKNGGEVVHSPGTRYRHYRPSVPVFICTETNLSEELEGRSLASENCGFIGYHSQRFDRHISIQTKAETYAEHLFAALRKLDKLGVDAIFVEPISEEGLGIAVMDRLRRAASN